jgi:hypothetical protein
MTDPTARRVGQEAARLLGAAQDWLRASAPHLAPTDDAGETCSCPLCRAVAGLRDADPDSVARWVDTAVAAATALATQAADLLAQPPTDPSADPWADPGTDHARASASGDDRGPGAPSDLGDDDPGPGATPSDDVAAGQDGSRPRQVRRIPVARDPDGAAT